MHVSVRRVRGCKRKKLKALAVSVAIDDPPWSGMPILPVQTQPTLDNADYSVEYRIPDTAISTPFTLDNPTDNAPTLFDNSHVELSNVFHSDISQTLPLIHDDFSVELLRAEPQGVGCGSAQEQWEGDASSMAAVVRAMPEACKDEGHGRHSTFDFSMTLEEWRPCGRRHSDFYDDYFRMETTQVASQCSWGAPTLTSYNTQYLETQFNPFMKENVPPLILNITTTEIYQFHYEWGIIKIVDAYSVIVDVEIFDPSPVTLLIRAGHRVAEWAGEIAGIDDTFTTYSAGAHQFTEGGL